MLVSSRITTLLWLLCAAPAAAEAPRQDPGSSAEPGLREASAAVPAEADTTPASVSDAPSFTMVCGRGIGVALGGQRTGIRWDFVTTGTFAWAASIDVGMWCERALGGLALRAYGAIDAVPTYLHLYSQVDRRQPLWIQARAGVTLPLGTVHGIGLHGVTSLATVGAGVHGRLQLPWGPPHGQHALDVRLDAFSGDVVGFQSSVLYDVQVQWW